jgi:hypothetical protein
MDSRTYYEELFWSKAEALHRERHHLQLWQCEMAIKREHPGLFQAVFGRDAHEKVMGAVDFHLSEGCSLEDAHRRVAQSAPELAGELQQFPAQQ